MQNNESIFINLALRDRTNLLKMRIVKIVYATVNRKVFIFYSRPNIYQDLASLLINAFRFQDSDHDQTQSSLFKREEECDGLVASDIIFALINDSLNRIEPIVYGFHNESKALNADIEKRKATERSEVMGRAFMAKENTIELMEEIENKLFFLEEMR